MKTLFAALLLISSTAFAEPCLEGLMCTDIDMKKIAGAHKQTFCGVDDLKICHVAVWIPFFSQTAVVPHYIDINSFQIDEEDVFITYKMMPEGNINGEGYDGNIDAIAYTVRFDCERTLYKQLSYQYHYQNRIVFTGHLKYKPVSVKVGGPLISELFLRTCSAHEIVVTGDKQ
jgi:hypothetical protein